jgi:hypothetical protein
MGDAPSTPTGSGASGKPGLGSKTAEKLDTIVEGAAGLGSVGIPVAVGAITAVLVALGISGDTLARLLRNQPGPIVAAFLLGLLAVGIAFVAALGKRKKVWRGFSVREIGVALGGVLLLAAAGTTVKAVVAGAGNREQPTVSMSVGPRPTPSPSSTVSTDTSVTVTVTGGAVSLQAKDRMLLRVMTPVLKSPAPTATPDVDSMWATCSTTAGELEPDSWRVLFVGESGPDATGKAGITTTVRLDPGAAGDKERFVCAHVVLKARANLVGHGEQRIPTPTSTDLDAKDEDNATDEDNAAGEADDGQRFVTSILDLSDGTP